MRGYKIICLANSYRDREFNAIKGMVTMVAESDPLVAKLQRNPSFKLEPCEVEDITPPPAEKKPAAKSEGQTPPPAEKVEGGEVSSPDDDIAKVPGIPQNLIPGLKAKGYDTVTKVLEAGVDALDEIDGIGPPTANQILLACSEYLGE